MYLSLKNLIARAKAESPTFFKRLKRLGIAVSALGVALIGLKSTYPANMAFLPDNIPGYLVTAGAAIASVCMLAVKDPDSDPNIK